jgi:hypothetical protein
MSSQTGATRLEKIMDWIAVVDIAILIIATIALLAGSPGLPFGSGGHTEAPSARIAAVAMAEG